MLKATRHPDLAIHTWRLMQPNRSSKYKLFFTQGGTKLIRHSIFDILLQMSSSAPPLVQFTRYLFTSSHLLHNHNGALSSAVGWGTALQVGRSRVRFHWHNPSGRTVALRSTQPLTEMSTRNTYRGKDSRCVRLTTLPPSCADCLEIWEPQPPGTLRASPDLYWDCFYLYIIITQLHHHKLLQLDSLYCD